MPLGTYALNRRLVWALLACTTLFAGCANFTSLNRETDLRFEKEADKYTHGKAIHLDAKQRLVIQNELGRICAEPAPDALSSLALSTSGSLTASSGEKLALANTLAESAGAIGLRTQSIQLMRDALYRVCEMYYSEGLSDVEVLALHRKYQDTLLAVLAVEQLTGAITPAPVVVSTSGSAESTANTRAVIDQLAKARETLTARKEELETLESELAEATEAHQKASDELEEKREKEEPVDAAEENVAKLEAEKTAAQEKVDNQKAAIQDTKDLIELLEDSRDASFNHASTSVSSDHQLGSVVTRDPLAAAKADAIAKSVKDIVTATSNKTYVVETCMGYIRQSQKSLEDIRLEHEKTKIESDDSLSRNQQKALKSSVQELIEHKNTLLSLVDTCKGVIEAAAIAEIRNRNGSAPQQEEPEDDDQDQGEEEDPGKLDPIMFKSGSLEPTTASASTLDKAVSQLKSDKSLVAMIVGHSDNDGGEQAKQNVSEKRAEKVKAILVSRGIDAHRIFTQGVSDTQPASGDADVRDADKDRRVEITLK